MRGEGNHKIPGSFAPENMEKTGAERVKYSLACQHEDAIPIKFVSYAKSAPLFCALLRSSPQGERGRNALLVKWPALCQGYVALRKESRGIEILVFSR